MTDKELVKEIKHLTDNWRDGKCFNCGTQMLRCNIGDEPLKYRCPKCEWNDRFTNQWNYLVDVGRIVGTIFYMTGAIGAAELTEWDNSS